MIVLLMQEFAKGLAFAGFERFLITLAFDQLYGIVDLMLISVYVRIVINYIRNLTNGFLYQLF